MAIFNAASTSPQALISQVQQQLSLMRQAMSAAEELHEWSSGVALADLTAPPPNGPGLSQADAQDVLSACADAWGMQELFRAGYDPRSPDPGYNYGASIRRVLGPRR